MEAVLELTDEQRAEARGHSRDDAPVVMGKERPAPAVVAETPAETTEQPGTDAAPQQDGGSTEAAGSATPETEQTWVTDEHRALASSYSLSEDELKGFATPDEFRRATRLIDRQIMAAAEAHRRSQQGNQPNTAQTQQNDTTAKPAESPKLTKLDLAKLKEAGYDEDTLNLLKTQNDVIDYVMELEKQRTAEREEAAKFKQEFTQMNSFFVQAEQQRRWNQFHQAVDTFDDPRFGKTVGPDGRQVNLTREALESRQQLAAAAQTLADHMLSQAQAAGVQPPPFEVVLKRAKQFLYPEDTAAHVEQVRAEERKKVQTNLTNQANRVRRVATTQPRNLSGEYASNKPLSINEEVDRISNLPAIQKMWNRALESVGMK